MITADDIAKIRRYGGGTKEMIADYGSGQQNVQVNVDFLVHAISRVLETSTTFSLPGPFPWTCLPPIHTTNHQP
jgi:hypothetical protein